MPRKRQINPEMWTNEQFVGLSVEARLLFIGLISHADDEGRLKGSTTHLKLIIFPNDGFQLTDMINFRKELIDQELAILYTVDNQEYIYLPKFYKHQFMTYRYPSSLPPAPDIPNRLKLLVNDKIRHEIYERDRFTCQYCGTPYNEGSRALSVDHIIPIDRGGITEFSNMVTCCKSCRGRKKNRTLEEADMCMVNGMLTLVNIEDDDDAANTDERTDERLKELLKLSGWGKKDGAKDMVWLNEFMESYPKLTPEHIRACRDYHSNKKTHTKAQWKSRLRNWMRIDGSKQEAQHGRQRPVQGSSRPGAAEYKYSDPT